MKNKKIIQLALFVALALFASSSVQASEVIGVLSSDVQSGTSGVIGGSVNGGGGGSQVGGNFGNGNVTGNNGSIGGTVTGGVNSGGTGGTGGGGGGGGGGVGVPVNLGPAVLGASVSPLAVNNTGTPTVLGASTVGFPDTGFPSKEQGTPWLAILSFGMLIMASHLLFRFLEKHTT